MATTKQNIAIEIVKLPSYVQLEREWRELENHSDASFFTSWSWAGSWLACLPEEIQPKLLRATSDNKIVGLGLLVSSHFRRYKFLPVKGYFLHATGDPLYDNITIEHNDFLFDRTTQSTIIPRLYEYLAALTDGWDELHLNGFSGIAASQLPTLTGLRLKRKKQCSYYVDLDEVRVAGGDYLSLLGQNTRYNIRRSIKEYAKHGQTVLTVAENLDDAFEYLAGLKQLHQTYWQSRGLPGAFANVFFELFHDRLIRTEFARGGIQLIRVSVGDRILGYLYNFVHHDQVLNYQSGFDYAICEKKNRPGMVIHSLAAEYNAARGYRAYDFLAGDSDYKLALGTHAVGMEWIVLQRKQLKFYIEDGLRNIKRLFTEK